MTKNTTIIAISILIIFGIVGYVALKPNFNTLNSVQSNSTISNSNSAYSNNNGMMGGISMNGDSMMMGMTHMSDLVKDDQSFLENMIPHHQEAVDSSNQILTSTQDPELKTFAQNVIAAQNKEIGEMKAWYKNWFNKDYTASSNYQAMMGGMNGKTGIELDKAYVQGMIMHHQGAIQMANKIQTITKRPELIKLANDIITSQTFERNTLMGWMTSKYNVSNR